EQYRRVLAGPAGDENPVIVGLPSERKEGVVRDRAHPRFPERRVEGGAHLPRREPGPLEEEALHVVTRPTGFRRGHGMLGTEPDENLTPAHRRLVPTD